MSLKQYTKKRKEQVLPALSAYTKKRKFSGKGKTTEPKGNIKTAKTKKLIFVVHDHHASHHHYDLRLEMNRVLRSWAVPKSPLELSKKGVKRLAIQVEDHPLEYARFQGTIPEGNYGAGKVEIFDKGEYLLKNETPNKIEFELKGKKLKGNYVLIKTHYRSKPDKSWLWFKV